MRNCKVTRRHLVLGSLALMATGCTPAVRRGGQVDASTYMPSPRFDPRFRPQRVRYDGEEKPGTIVVVRAERFLYLVEEDGSAMRYGVGVGREGRTLTGRASIQRKAEWPSWTPTADMMQREPRLLQYASGVPGGPDNPLGARALYLYRDGRDTMFRIHGTNNPWTIGQAVSSGCIRLMNDDIVDLYDRTPIGTPVLVI
jgi:lipoprotein-anchoring transpeptidase ErfK/SrfK